MVSFGVVLWPVLHDLRSLSLVSEHWRKEASLLVRKGLVLADQRPFPVRSLGGCLLGTSCEAVALSVVGFPVGGLIASGAGWHGFCLVP